MNSNLNLNTLPECKFAYRMVNSALLIPCIEYQRMLRMEKVFADRGKLTRSTSRTSRRSATGMGASMFLMGRTRWKPVEPVTVARM